MNHLPLHRLESDAELDASERAHLEACDRCRVEARLLRDVADATLEGLDDIATTFADLRTAWRATLTAPAAATAPEEVLPPLSDRYLLADRLGRGGMGDVFRAHDTVLDRPVALKLAHPRLLEVAGARARFLVEARVGARLQHPGVVPVHDLGTLPDGRPCFVMKEVDGITLRAAMADPAWPLRRLVAALGRVADTIAYAHDRGVVHRDLKPDNLMLGAFGEVWVLDWGIARVRGLKDAAGQSHGLQTRVGAVAGTPAYMAPEQARGDGVGPAVDLYALGAVLYELLCGHTPFRAPTADALLEAVRTETPTPLRSGKPELDELTTRLLDRDPTARPTAIGLSRALTDWLDGRHRHERAAAELARVAAHQDRSRSLSSRAEQLATRAKGELDALASWAGPAARADAWALQDQARRMLDQARALDGELVASAHAALSHAPDFEDAHDLLASHYQRAHARAEREGLPAEHLEALLRTHDRGSFASYLAQQAELILHTEAGVQVQLSCLIPAARRLEPDLKLTAEGPLVRTEVTAGSYRIELSQPGRPSIALPAQLGRAERWQPTRPGDPHPWVHRLPATLEPGSCYIPAGWTPVGGDPHTPSSLPARRVWVDDVVITADPITVRQYLTFLDDLVATGREDEALQHAPRERAARPGEQGDLLVDHTSGEGFAVRPDAEGDVWQPDWPVIMVSWHGARAYAAWRAQRSGLAWRLPWELEWARAARGADARFFPWGDTPESTWAHVDGSRPGRSLPGRVSEVREDVSPFGVRHLAGNVCDWLLDAHSPDGPTVSAAGRFVPPPVDEQAPRRTVRGGSWAQPISWGRAAFRSGWDGSDRRWVIGFRLARTP